MTKQKIHKKRKQSPDFYEILTEIGITPEIAMFYLFSYLEKTKDPGFEMGMTHKNGHRCSVIVSVNHFTKDKKIEQKIKSITPSVT